MPTTKRTPEALLDELVRARAMRKNRLDLPGILTERQKADYEHHTAALDGVIFGIRHNLEMLVKPTGRLEMWLPAHERLVAAKVEIEKEIADAPDWRTIADPRARDAEWGRQSGLASSLTALHQGVEFFNGVPALPSELRSRLTTTCDSCGHGELHWLGSLTALDSDIANAKQQISTLRSGLDSLVATAESLLQQQQSDAVTA